MRKTRKSSVSLALVLAMILCIAPALQIPAAATDIISDFTITEGGDYHLVSGASGLTITVATGDPVVIEGNGIGASAVPNSWVYINCSGVTANLTLSNVYLSNDQNDAELNTGDEYHNIINFSGPGNILNLVGENIIDQNLNASGKAAIHVDYDCGLTITGGDSTLYLYKHEMGAGIGGDQNELNGSIIFDGPTIFAKGSKQGAVIGSGANTNGALSGRTSKDIMLLSGTLYIVSNARGAAIGGGAGARGGVPGGIVYVVAGMLTVNVDWSGAAIGGGGYDGGNDSAGGAVYLGNASVKTYIDVNALSQWQSNGHNVTEAGSNDTAITAGKFSLYNESDVYLLKLDTAELECAGDDYFTVLEGQAPLYEGGLHTYKYAYDDFDRDNGTGGAIEIGVSYTPDNWVPSGDTNLYLYLTSGDHTLNVNGEAVEVKWENGGFVVGSEPEPSVILGDVDGNGIITSNDATLVFQAASKMVQFTAAQELAADVDGNGIISSNDATLIFQYASKLINKFPADNN